MANPSGKICLGFNMGNPDHEQVKKILDSLPKGAKSNFIVTAVLEYWIRHGKVIDARDYRKNSRVEKRSFARTLDDDKPSEELAASDAPAQQPSPITSRPEAFTADPGHTDGGDDRSEEDDALKKIFMQGLNSFI